MMRQWYVYGEGRVTFVSNCTSIIEGKPSSPLRLYLSHFARLWAPKMYAGYRPFSRKQHLDSMDRLYWKRALETFDLNSNQ